MEISENKNETATSHGWLVLGRNDANPNTYTLEDNELERGSEKHFE